ncbi:MAG: hypothetical protein BWK76_01900 [Desulfobulbaceae bacterium A2]|nr:MAG: hypothetical protein BWK76_01900 [Desulfobulbaceae bacterium A2]
MSNETLFDELSAVFTLRRGAEQQQSCRFRDSFDWRLYRENLVLCDEGGFWRLLRRSDGEELARGRTRGNGEGPRRPAQLAAGRLREQLEKLLGVRALLPLAGVRRSRQELAIENSDAKIVVRLLFDCWTIEGAVGEERLLRLEEMRGYGEEFAAVQAMLPRLGLVVAGGLEQLFVLALRAAGREPLDYSAKFQAALTPEMPAGHALRQIGAILLDIMRRNERGIIEDIDPEFLHDFRVAVRRTRAALGQFKGVLAPASLAWLLAEFSWLGRLSNGARDLDVLLHSEKAWSELLPPELRPGLHPFFVGLTRRRRGEYRQLVQALGSERYHELLRRWQEILRGEGREESTGPHAGRPTLRLARRIIERRWRRILTDGAVIDETSPPATLHQLRIQCKKLRYALEFFRSVLPDEACRELIIRLKHLQDNLGSYNDLSVQEGVVRQYLAGLGTKDKDIAAAASAGGLLARLDQERQRLRQEFADAFAAFAGEVTTGLLRVLLGDASG